MELESATHRPSWRELFYGEHQPAWWGIDGSGYVANTPNGGFFSCSGKEILFECEQPRVYRLLNIPSTFNDIHVSGIAVSDATTAEMKIVSCWRPMAGDHPESISNPAIVGDRPCVRSQTELLCIQLQAAKPLKLEPK